MTSARTASSPSRQRAIALLVAFAAAVAFANFTSPTAGAAAARVPTHVAVTSLVSTVATPPGALGAPAALIQAGKAFTVSVELQGEDGNAYPVSTNKDTVVRVQVADGASTLVGGATTATIPGGESTASFENLVLAPAANHVVLAITVMSGTKAALALTPATTSPFDVVVSSSTTEVLDRGRSLTVSRDGVDVPCEPTAEMTTCVDLVLPMGVASDVFFSTGVCDAHVGCESGRDVIQVLADLGTAYGNRTPATVIVKCDKSLCGGGGVPTYRLKVNLDATGPLADAPACRSKGIIPSGMTSCVDYVQSKRDGAGDTHIYWLVSRDARSSCC
jgi:hypothetical protein